MTTRADAIIERIRALELELEAELARQGAGLKFGLERGRVAFDAEVVRRHKELRTHLAAYILSARPLVALTAPLIYSLVIPFVLVDIWVSIYQAVCFRVYRIPQVRRGRYMIFDRSGLAYLNALEKLNCAYCSYLNGIVGYVREVASRTEQYWCPIKHARRLLGAHARYAGFEAFGNGEDYRRRLAEMRAALLAESGDPLPPPAP
jgi:hypothetical protein